MSEDTSVTDQNQPVAEAPPKKSRRTAIYSLVLVVLCLLAYYPVRIAIAIYIMVADVKSGIHFLQNLTEKDLEPWAKRSESLWKENPNPKYSIGVYSNFKSGKPIPEELKALKITRLDIHDDKIYYCWQGGFDHTSLIVEKTNEKELLFTAEYHDDNLREIGRYIHKD